MSLIEEWGLNAASKAFGLMHVTIHVTLPNSIPWPEDCRINNWNPEDLYVPLRKYNPIKRVNQNEHNQGFKTIHTHLPQLRPEL